MQISENIMADATLSKIALRLIPRHVQHRTHDPAAHRRNPAQSAQACAAGQIQQNRLGVVVSRVSRGDETWTLRPARKSRLF